MRKTTKAAATTTTTAAVQGAGGRPTHSVMASARLDLRRVLATQTHRTKHRFTSPRHRRVPKLTLEAKTKASSGEEFVFTETHVSSGTEFELRYRQENDGVLLVGSTDKASSGASTSGRGKASLPSPSGLVQRTFFPEGGEDAVTGDYWGFSFWTFVKGVVSASTSVLGTQGLLRAVGVGAAASVASSAAINWVLKDGLGRVGCMVFASIIGNKFDDDAKFFVFLGDVMYEVGILLEILSPLFAHLFLVVASAANAFKSMSYMSRLPPRAAILKSFAARENVGDVSAKANSQDVVSGLLGLLLGIQISFLVGTSVWKSLVVFLLSGAVVCFASLRALSNLRLNTLNRHRTEIVLRCFVGEGEIPSVRDVNRAEGALATLRRIPSGGSGNREFSTVFGAPLAQVVDAACGRDVLGDLMEFYRNEQFVLALAPKGRGRRMRALVMVDPEITAESTLLALLQCAYAEDALRGRRASDVDLNEEAKKAYAAAKASFPKVLQGLRDSGWSMGHVLWIPKCLLKRSSDRRESESEAVAKPAEPALATASSGPRLTDLGKDPSCNSPVCEAPNLLELEVSVTEDKA